VNTTTGCYARIGRCWWMLANASAMWRCDCHRAAETRKIAHQAAARVSHLRPQSRCSATRSRRLPGCAAAIPRPAICSRHQNPRAHGAGLGGCGNILEHTFYTPIHGDGLLERNAVLRARPDAGWKLCGSQIPTRPRTVPRTWLAEQRSGGGRTIDGPEVSVAGKYRRTDPCGVLATSSGDRSAAV